MTSGRSSEGMISRVRRHKMTSSNISVITCFLLLSGRASCSPYRPEPETPSSSRAIKQVGAPDLSAAQTQDVRIRQAPVSAALDPFSYGARRTTSDVRSRPVRTAQVVYAPTAARGGAGPHTPLVDVLDSVRQYASTLETRGSAVRESLVSPSTADGHARRAPAQHATRPRHEALSNAEAELLTLNDPSVVEIRETRPPPMVQYNEDGSLYSAKTRPAHRRTAPIVDKSHTPQKRRPVKRKTPTKLVLVRPRQSAYHRSRTPVQVLPSKISTHKFRQGNRRYPYASTHTPKRHANVASRQFSSRQGFPLEYQHPSQVHSDAFVNTNQRSTHPHMIKDRNGAKLEIGENDEVIVLRVPEDVLASKQNTNEPYPMVFTAPSRTLLEEANNMDQYPKPQPQKEKQHWWNSIPFISQLAQRRESDQHQDTNQASASEVDHSFLPPPPKNQIHDPYLSKTKVGEYFYPTEAHVQQSAFESIPDFLKPILNPIRRFVLPDELHNPFRGGYTRHRLGYQYNNRVPYYPAPYHPQSPTKSHPKVSDTKYKMSRPLPDNRKYDNEVVGKMIESDAASEPEIGLEKEYNESPQDPHDSDISVIDTGDYFAVIQGDINKIIRFQNRKRPANIFDARNSYDDTTSTPKEKELKSLQGNDENDPNENQSAMRKMSLSEALQNHSSKTSKNLSRKKRQIRPQFRNRRPHQVRQISRRHDLRAVFPSSAKQTSQNTPHWESTRFAPQRFGNERPIRGPVREHPRVYTVQDIVQTPTSARRPVIRRQRVNHRSPKLSLSAPRIAPLVSFFPPEAEQTSLTPDKLQIFTKEATVNAAAGTKPDGPKNADKFKPSMQFGFVPFDTPQKNKIETNERIQVDSAQSNIVNQFIAQSEQNQDTSRSVGSTEPQRTKDEVLSLSNTPAASFANSVRNNLPREVINIPDNDLDASSPHLTTLRIDRGHAVLKHPIHEIKTFSRGIIIRPTAVFKTGTPTQAKHSENTKNAQFRLSPASTPVKNAPKANSHQLQGQSKISQPQIGNEINEDNLITNSVTLINPEEAKPIHEIDASINVAALIKAKNFTSYGHRTYGQAEPMNKPSTKSPLKPYIVRTTGNITNELSVEHGRRPVIRKVIRVTKVRTPGRRRLTAPNGRRHVIRRRPISRQKSKIKTTPKPDTKRKRPEIHSSGTHTPIVFGSKFRQDAKDYSSDASEKLISTTSQPVTTTSQPVTTTSRPVTTTSTNKPIDKPQQNSLAGNIAYHNVAILDMKGNHITGDTKEENDPSDEYVDTNTNGTDLVAVPSQKNRAIQSPPETAKYRTKFPLISPKPQTTTERASTTQTKQATTTASSQSTQDTLLAPSQQFQRSSQPYSWLFRRQPTGKVQSKTRYRVPTLPVPGQLNEGSAHTQLQKYLDKYAEKYGLNRVNSSKFNGRFYQWPSYKPSISGLKPNRPSTTQVEDPVSTENTFDNKDVFDAYYSSATYDQKELAGSQYSYRFQPPPSTFVRAKPKQIRLAALLNSSKITSSVRTIKKQYPFVRNAVTTPKPLFDLKSTTRRQWSSIWDSAKTKITENANKHIINDETTPKKQILLVKLGGDDAKRDDSISKSDSSEPAGNEEHVKNSDNLDILISSQPEFKQQTFKSFQDTSGILSDQIEPEGQSSLFSVVYSKEQPQNQQQQPEIYTRLNKFLRENGAEPPSSIQVTLGTSQKFQQHQSKKEADDTKEVENKKLVTEDDVQNKDIALQPSNTVLSEDGTVIVQAMPANVGYDSWFTTTRSYTTTPQPTSTPEYETNPADTMVVYPGGVSVLPETPQHQQPDTMNLSEEVVYYTESNQHNTQAPHKDTYSSQENLENHSFEDHPSTEPVATVNNDDIDFFLEKDFVDINRELFAEGSEQVEHQLDSHRKSHKYPQTSEEQSDLTQNAQETTQDPCINHRCSFIHEPGRTIRMQH